MSDLSINSTSLLQYLSSASSTQSTSQTSSTTASDVLSSLSSTDTTQAANVGVSKFAKLVKELNALKEQDPAKYKEVVTQIADQLKTAASQSSGTDQKFLSNLAATFTKAEDGSSLSLPQPPGNGNGSGSAVEAAYSAGQQTSADQQMLTSLGDSTSSSQSGPSASTQSTMDSIFQLVNNAVSGLTS